jgi:hypothetical protein
VLTRCRSVPLDSRSWPGTATRAARLGPLPGRMASGGGAGLTGGGPSSGRGGCAPLTPWRAGGRRARGWPGPPPRGRRRAAPCTGPPAPPCSIPAGRGAAAGPASGHTHTSTAQSSAAGQARGDRGGRRRQAGRKEQSAEGGRAEVGVPGRRRPPR